MKSFFIPLSLLLLLTGPVWAEEPFQVGEYTLGTRPVVDDPIYSDPPTPWTYFPEGFYSRQIIFMYDEHDYIAGGEQWWLDGRYMYVENGYNNQAEIETGDGYYEYRKTAYRQPLAQDDANSPGEPPCEDCPPMPAAGQFPGKGLDAIRRSMALPANDFGVGPGAACGTCVGAPPPAGTHVPMSLSLQRTQSFHLADQRSSFGPGVIGSYDANVTVSADGGGTITAVEWFSAGQSQPFLCTPTGTTGVFANASHTRIQDMRLYDAGLSLTGLLAAAVTAEVRFWDGSTERFEIFSLGSDQVRHGRLVEQGDRVGNATVLTYVDPVTASDAALGYDRTKLWRIAIIADPQGLVAAPTYGWHDGQWVVESFACPDGTTRTYGYGVGNLTGLNSVTYPGGDQSTFSTSYDFGNDEQRIEITDVGAPGKIRTGVLGLTPSRDVRGGVAPNRVRRWEDGAQKLATLCWTERLDTVDADGADTYTYTFEGGGDLAVPMTAQAGTLVRVGMSQGQAVATYQAITWNLLEDPSTYTWELIERTTFNAKRQMIARIMPNDDASGLTSTYTRDSVTGSLMGVEKSVNGTSLVASSVTRNAFQQPLVETNERGFVTSSTYDGVGNRLTETVALGTAEEATRSWTYNGRGQVLTATDFNGNVTTYTYDANGYLLSRLDPPDVPGGPQALWQWSYDAVGRLETSTDPQSRVVSYDYDGRGRLVLTTYADSTTEIVTYGSGATANLVVSRTDRNGHVTAYTYDDDGRVETETVGTDDPTTQDTVTFTYLPGTELLASRSGFGSASTFTYDYRQRQIAVERLVGGSATLTQETTYDSQGRISVETDPYDRRQFYVYDLRNRLVRTVQELVPGGVTAPATVATLLRSTVANPPYVITDLVYDDGDNLVARIDGRGIRSTLAYDARDRVVAMVEAEAQLESGGTYTTIFADAARTVTAYDDNSNVVRIELPRSFVRDPGLGWIQGDEGDFWTTWTYSGRNLKLSETVAAGPTLGDVPRAEQGTTTWTYTLTGKVASTTDPRGNATNPVTAGFQTLFRYGTCCDRLTEIEDPQGNVTSFTYDGNGNRISATDPNLNTTTWTYDAHDRVLTQTNAENEATTIAYDEDLSDALGLSDPGNPKPVLPYLTGIAAHRAIRTTNAEGEASFTLVDGLGRTIRSVDPLGHATTTTFDAVASGLVETSYADALNHVTQSRVDGAGLVREAEDALGKVSTAAYDANGNRLQIRDANGIGQDCLFDVRNRDIQCTDTAGAVTSREYDAHGNVVVSTDALSQEVTSVYDARDRKVSTTDRIDATTTFTYDLADNLKAILDAEGGLTEYEYDSRNLLTVETFPNGQQGRTVRTYAYDFGRRLESRTITTSPASAFTEQTGYDYDAANRMVTRSYADGLNDAFTYDNASRLLTATSARYGTMVTRVYDDASRLTGESLQLANGTLTGITVGTATYDVGYAYDAANRLTATTYPDTTVVSRTWTDRNELDTVTHAGQLIIDRTYDDGMRLTSTAYGNGLVESRTYVTGDNLVETIAIPAVTGFSYAYDANKRKLTESDAILTASSQTFGYDDQDRLTSWSRPSAPGGDTQSWDLSPVGDWDQTVRNADTQVRTHTDVHELTGIATNGGATIPLLYDAKGNLTQDDRGVTLSWDPENRLIAARVPSTASTSYVGLEATYQYDALGRRVAKTVNGRTTVYACGGAQVLNEFERAAIPSQAALDGAAADGVASALDTKPASGGILQTPGTIRINAQPATTVIPGGFWADKGSVYGMRTHGASYGWLSTQPASRQVSRSGAAALAEFDTHTRLQPSSESAGSWSIALPNGSYPIIVVCGDPLSTQQTNDLTINGIALTDPDPATAPGYTQGDFDGYAIQATVTNGFLTLDVAGTAVDPKLCFIEIGPEGSLLTQADIDRLDALIAQMTDATWEATALTNIAKAFVYSVYVDDLASYTVGLTRRYVHSNHLYSPSAVTSSAGTVVERMRYDAYGKRTVLNAAGTAEFVTSSASFDRGFTGFILDTESSLCFARTRMYSPFIGGFLGRDMLGYVDGSSLYRAYFSPNGTDSTGMWQEGGHFYTIYIIGRIHGMSHDDAKMAAYWTQYADEDNNFDAFEQTLEREAEWLSAEAYSLFGQYPDTDLYDDYESQREWSLSLNNYIHSLHGGGEAEIIERRRTIECLLKKGNLSDMERGLLNHAYGDTYSHIKKGEDGKYQAYGSEWGHGKDSGAHEHLGLGAEPDRISTDFGRYEAYVMSFFSGATASQQAEARRFLDYARSIPPDPEIEFHMMRSFNPYGSPQGSYEDVEISRVFSDRSNSYTAFFPEGGKNTALGQIPTSVVKKVIEMIKCGCD